MAERVKNIGKVALTYKGAWVNTTQYGKLDTVYIESEKSTYIALEDNKGVNPVGNPNTWGVLAKAKYEVGQDDFENAVTTVLTTHDNVIKGKIDNADKWTTPIKLNGVDLDGTKDVTITAVPSNDTNLVHKTDLVGGRNLLLGTGTAKTGIGTNKTNDTFNAQRVVYPLSGGMTVADLVKKYGANASITASYDWETTTENPSGKFQLQWNDIPWGFSTNAETPSVTNKSGHVVITRPLNTNSWSYGTANNMIFRQDNLVGNITIKNLKLEAGNVPTDWTPAPEDKANDADVVHNTGNETIAGDKTFTSPIIGSIKTNIKPIENSVDLYKFSPNNNGVYFVTGTVAKTLVNAPFGSDAFFMDVKTSSDNNGNVYTTLSAISYTTAATKNATNYFNSSENSVENKVVWTQSGVSGSISDEDRKLLLKLNNEVLSRGVNVKLFGAKGDGVTDDTESIQQAVDFAHSNNYNKVIVPEGTYMVKAHSDVETPNFLHDEGGIKLYSNISMMLNADATLKVIPNDKKAYNILRIYNQDNVEVSGGNFIGDRDTHTGETGEWGYGISISGSTNVSLSNMKLSNMFGDGINLQVIKKDDGSFVDNEDITVTNIVSDNNRRQGLSIESGKNVYISDSVFSNTNGTLPEAGIDIEPWTPNASIENVTIERSSFVGNVEEGILVVTTNANNINIKDSVFDNNKGTKTKNGQVTTNVKAGSSGITIANNVFKNDSNTSVSLRGGYSYKVIGNSLEKGMLVAGTATESIKGLSILNNVLKTKVGATPLFDTVNLSYVQDVNIDDNMFDGSNTYNSRALVYLENVVDVSVTNNGLINSAYGILVRGGNNIKVKSNLIDNAGINAVNFGATTNMLVKGNTFYGTSHQSNGNAVVSVINDTSNTQIKENNFYQKARYNNTNNFGTGVSVQALKWVKDTSLDLTSQGNKLFSDGTHNLVFSDGSNTLGSGFLQENNNVMTATTGTLPKNAAIGTVAFNTTTSSLVVYNGNKWADVPNDTSVVHNTGNETIAGNKTFTGTSTFGNPIIGGLGARLATFKDFNDIAKNMNAYSGNWQILASAQIVNSPYGIAPRSTYVNVQTSGWNDAGSITYYDLITKDLFVGTVASGVLTWTKIAKDSEVVHNTGNETIAGNKTLSGSTTLSNTTILSGDYGLRVTSSGFQKTTDGGATWVSATL